MKIDIGFVILQYLCREETAACVDSVFRNIDTRRCHVVVVDNHSDNGSYEFLLEKYGGDGRMSFIRNGRNEGFARGNNAGIRFLNRNFDCRFICVLNNDVILLERHLHEKLSAAYAAERFAVAGPMILTGDGRCDCNPTAVCLRGRADIARALRRTQIKLLFARLRLPFLYRVLDRVLRRLSGGKCAGAPGSARPPFLCARRGVRLHGCFLVFSREYFRHFEGFDGGTFLFHEEDILQYHLMRKGLTSVYLPEILVYHGEDAATNIRRRGKLRRMIFKYRQSEASLRYFLELVMGTDTG